MTGEVWESGGVKLICGDALQEVAALPANSIDLIATDPPYYKVKDEAWDRQWNTAEGFLAWLDSVLAEFARVLRSNGSLYLFASPRMAARVEVLIGKRFNVLNQIVWYKSNGNRNWSADKSAIRSFLPNTERIIFAEHYGADNMAKGEAGYGAKCDELRGFVFEPLRAYLDDERQRAGIDFEQVRQIVGCAEDSGLPSHWFTRSQWILPTAENYAKLREGFARLNRGGDYLRREYEDLRREYDYLRREYDYLRREYEDLRRPFSVSADVPYTDVWAFPTVSAYPGKHPCEKPLAMMRHIIRASSQPDAVVLDCFAGSGTIGLATMIEGRQFVGMEIDEGYFNMARKRILDAQRQLVMPLEAQEAAT